MGPVFTSSSVNIFTAVSRSAYCVDITAFCFAYVRRLLTRSFLVCSSNAHLLLVVLNRTVRSLKSDIVMLIIEKSPPYDGILLLLQ
jgi:hypothetical protein